MLQADSASNEAEFCEWTELAALTWAFVSFTVVLPATEEERELNRTMKLPSSF